MNSINYPNYTINVDNISAIGDTLYLGTLDTTIQLGNSGSILDLYGILKINGSSGTTGQVLSVDETGPSWTSATTSSLSQVMSVGNTTGTILDMNYNDIIRVHGISGSNIYLTTNSLYVNGSSGTTGQVLSVDETGPSWTSVSSLIGPSGVTGSTSIDGGTLELGDTKIIYGNTIPTVGTKIGTIYFNHTFTSTTSYSLSLTMLDPSVTDNFINITQKGTTSANYHMQKIAANDHQINWIAIGH